MLSTRMSSITTILLVVMACSSLLLFSQPTATFASRVEVRASGYELSVSEDGSGGREDMAPGDVEETKVTVANEGEEAFDVTVSVERVGDGGEEGDPLFACLRVTILKEGVSRWEGSMNEAKNLNLGTVAQGESNAYTFRVEFPLEAGNEFQNERVTIKWVFRATWPQGPGTDPGEEPGDDPGGDDPGSGDPGDDPTPPADEGGPTTTAEDEEVTIAEEEIPTGTVEMENGEEELIPVEEDEIPGGPKEIPRTGEAIPFLFYGMGLALISGGLALVRRRAQ